MSKDLRKTEFCWNLLSDGGCKYGGNCLFAHDKEELRKRPRPRRYKTRLCEAFHKTGTCAYGVRCIFAHSLEEQVPIKYNLPEVAEVYEPLALDTEDSDGESDTAFDEFGDAEDDKDAVWYQVVDQVLRESTPPPSESLPEPPWMDISQWQNAPLGLRLTMLTCL